MYGTIVAREEPVARSWSACHVTDLVTVWPFALRNDRIANAAAHKVSALAIETFNNNSNIMYQFLSHVWENSAAARMSQAIFSDSSRCRLCSYIE